MESEREDDGERSVVSGGDGGVEKEVKGSWEINFKLFVRVFRCRIVTKNVEDRLMMRRSFAPADSNGLQFPRLILNIIISRGDFLQKLW